MRDECPLNDKLEEALEGRRAVDHSPFILTGLMRGFCCEEWFGGSQIKFNVERWIPTHTPISLVEKCALCVCLAKTSSKKIPFDEQKNFNFHV